MKTGRLGWMGIFGVAVAGLAPSVASAGLLAPTPYQSFAGDSPFSGTTFAYFHLEDFEDGALNTPGVSADFGVIAQPGSATDSVDADDGLIDGSGLAGHSYYSNFESASITFTFDAAALGGNLPTHVGVVWTDVGRGTALAIDDVTFSAVDGAGVSLGTIGPFTLGDGNVLGGTLEDRFFGVTSANGIRGITLTMANSTDWELDHLQYGFVSPRVDAVPEPGTYAALGLGLGGLAAVASRRRRARPRG